MGQLPDLLPPSLASLNMDSDTAMPPFSHWATGSSNLSKGFGLQLYDGGSFFGVSLFMVGE